MTLLALILSSPEELPRLQASGQLEQALPELARLYGVPQNPEHHPEVCTGRHIELCLEMAVKLEVSEPVRFAVLMHDLGKGLTPPADWPRHIDHETRGLAPLQQLCEREQVTQYARDLALLVCEWHLHAHKAFVMSSRGVLRFLVDSGLLTAPDNILEDFLLACECDKRGRLGREDAPYTPAPFLRKVVAALRELPIAAPDENKLTYAWQQWHRQRLNVVRTIRAQYA